VAWVLVCAAGMAAAPGVYTKRIAVDQFGYAPAMTKVAVISNPQTGFNAAESYIPGATLEVRSWPDHAVVFSGAPTTWNGGQTDAQSGDRAWWFDFTPVTQWGEYYVYDPGSGFRSARFRVHHQVYEEVLKQAVRVFYYQRRGTAKVVPYADPRWTDSTNFMGPLQDTQCRLVTNPQPSSQRDLRGGWFDAGDYNKYTMFTDSTLSDLLFAFRQNPLIWPDDWNIPESGDGIADLLNELKWELDWLLRMQNPNGSVLSKMGVNQFQGASPPSSETTQIFYGTESTTATLSSAATFAQAACAYRLAGQSEYSLALSNAAISAYTWAVANPSVIYSNTGFASANPEVDVGNYAYERDRLRVRAAVHLYELTGQSAYRTYVESTYSAMHALVWGWWGPYEASVQDSLLHFTTLPGVSASVVNAIRNSKQNSINGSDFITAWNTGRDPYRAYVSDASYHWGNNQVKSHVGLLFDKQLVYNLNPAQAPAYRAAAAGFLHYLHGVNALTLAFLSNMYEHGADDCANEMYHSWFGNGTIYDNALTSPNGPAPGYITGGANKNFAPDPAYSGPPLVPPMNQPPQKAYLDWNTSWPENSWEITEPSIYNQAAYVYLLSRYVVPMAYSDWTTGYGLNGAAADLSADPDGDKTANLVEYALGLSPLVNDTNSLPVFRLQTHTVSGQTNRYLTVQFPRQMGSTNLTYTVQGSLDLTNWTALCTAASTNPPSGPGFIGESGTSYQREILARDTVPVESAVGPRYVRIQLTWN